VAEARLGLLPAGGGVTVRQRPDLLTIVVMVEVAGRIVAVRINEGSSTA
jgi:hypothetical protein